MTDLLVLVLVVLAAWSFAEAFSWPIAPDAALAGAVFLWPTIAVQATASVIIGTMIGGALALSLHRSGYRWPLPLVTDRMRERVASWLDQGVFGLRHQPLTAVPYKAFVVDAAGRPFATPTWALLTGLFRGMRMGANALVAFGAAILVEGMVADDRLIEAKLVVLVVAATLFVAGWRAVYLFWRRTPNSPEPTPFSAIR